MKSDDDPYKNSKLGKLQHFFRRGSGELCSEKKSKRKRPGQTSYLLLNTP